MIKSEAAHALCINAEQQKPPLDYVVEVATATTPKLKAIAPQELLRSIAKNHLIRSMTTNHLAEDRKNSYSHIGYNQLFKLLYQRIAEVYFQEKIRAATQEIPYPIELIDIPDGTEAGNYRYRKGALGNTEVIDKDSGELITDIDGLLAIAENGEEGRYCGIWQPFIVEVKMSAFGHCRESEELDHHFNNHHHFNNLTQVINIPYSLKAIPPVLEYFQELYRQGEIENEVSDVGIIVGMLPDRVNLVRAGSQRKFVGRGGNIIKFHTDYKGYHQLVYSVADRFILNVA